MTNESTILGATLEIDDKNASIVLGNFPGKVKKASDEVNKIGNNPLAEKLITDFDALAKRTEETRLRFAEIGKIRLDNGQIGSLTREVLTAQTHSRQLAADIANIRKELANPNRTSSITFLSASLRAAEAEADRLGKKLNSLPSGATQGGANLKLSSFQKQNLSYQINDVVTGLASGQNPTQILAQQGGQIAQIFNPAQIAAFAAQFSTLIPILGAGAAAIALIYKITGDMREQAEKYLALQTKITGELNKQRLTIKESDRQFAEQLANAARRDNFSRSVSNDSIDSLKLREQRIEESLKRLEIQRVAVLNTFGKDSDQDKRVNNDIVQTQNELADAKKRLRDLPFERNAQSLQLFNQNNENFKRSQQNIAEYEKKRVEEAAKLREKLQEKTSAIINDFNDFLVSAKASDNPYVKLLNDMDTAGARAQKRFGELARVVGDDLAAQFVKLASSAEMAQLSTKLFEARLDGKLEAFNLREKANDYRKPIGESREAMAKRIEGIVKEYLSADQRLGIGGQNAGNALLANRPKNLTDAQLQQDLFEYATLFNSSMQKGNQQDTIRYLASVRRQMRGEDMNLSIQERLDKQFGIVNSIQPKTEQERAIADKRITALSSGLRPDQLTNRQREQIAASYDRQAVRADQLEKEAIKDRTEMKNMLSAIAKALNEKGIKVDMPPPQVNITLKGVEATSDDFPFLPSAPR